MDFSRNIAIVEHRNGAPGRALQRVVRRSSLMESQAISISDISREELQSGTLLVLVNERNGEHLETTTHALAQPCLGGANKDDPGPTGVSIWLVQGVFWTWLDGGLYLPDERHFAGRVERCLQMFECIRTQGVSFEGVRCDASYGHDGWFRAALDARQFQYMVDIPAKQRVYLPEAVPNWRGRAGRLLMQDDQIHPPTLYCADQLPCHPQTAWQHFSIQVSNRFALSADFAAHRVWTVWQAETGRLQARQEWLVIRRDQCGKCSYALSNLSPESTLRMLARYKAQQFFAEPDPNNI